MVDLAIKRQEYAAKEALESQFEGTGERKEPVAVASFPSQPAKKPSLAV